MTVLVTGGAGFIGSNFILDWMRSNREAIVNVDALTYASDPALLSDVDSTRYAFVRADIRDEEAMLRLFAEHKPRAVVHFAAESHVDRGIKSPRIFVDTNVSGTLSLLQASLVRWKEMGDEAGRFRFLHVSTDEVFGSLLPDEAAFTEESHYRPNSPYSASKAASDHLVRAWHETYGLPVVTTHCSNNYGPRQFPEKLIPLVITRALAGQHLPVYGDGKQVRDWLYVSDHVTALQAVLKDGKPGETYNVGGWNEHQNIEIVKGICSLLDEMRPDQAGPYERLIRFVADRPGHDRRYAIDARKIERELGWKPAETFASGLRKTVRWYLDNQVWAQDFMKSHSIWMAAQYGQGGR